MEYISISHILPMDSISMVIYFMSIWKYFHFEVLKISKIEHLYVLLFKKEENKFSAEWCYHVIKFSDSWDSTKNSQKAIIFKLKGINTWDLFKRLIYNYFLLSRITLYGEECIMLIILARKKLNNKNFRAV